MPLSILAIVLSNSVLFVAGFLLVELTFGVWISYDPMMSLNLIRDAKYEFHVSGLYASLKPRVRYRRDKFGFRGLHGWPLNIDILTLWGSAADQRYLDEEDTWQEVMRARFGTEGRNTRIANAGIDGQSTYRHIKSFESWFPRIPGLRQSMSGCISA